MAVISSNILTLLDCLHDFIIHCFLVDLQQAGLQKNKWLKIEIFKPFIMF